MKLHPALASLTAVCILIGTATQAQTGNVGIGTASPVAKLQVVDGNVFFTATSPVGKVPDLGKGNRMMWLADRGAFRAGYGNEFNWNNDSIGSYSFAAG